MMLVHFSSHLLTQLSLDIRTLSNIISIEGWTYLIITIIILSILLKHYTKVIHSSEVKLQQQLAESLQQQTIIKEQNEYLLLLLAAIPDLIFHFDKNGFFVDYKTTSNMEISPNLVNPFIGKSVYDLLPAALAKDTIVSIAKVLDTNDLHVMEYHLPINNQDRYWEAKIVKLNDSQVLVIARDTTQRSQLLKELHYVSLHDHLTGLYNRAYFEQQMQQLHGTKHVPVTIFVCDLDGLKSINDRLGHQFGDQLLKNAAKVLSEAFNAHDIIARIGGDEFAILLPNTSPHEAQAAYQRIQAAESAYNAKNPGLILGISIGWSVSDQQFANMNELFLAADTNMYKQKNLRKS